MATLGYRPKISASPARCYLTVPFAVGLVSVGFTSYASRLLGCHSTFFMAIPFINTGITLEIR